MKQKPKTLKGDASTLKDMLAIIKPKQVALEEATPFDSIKLPDEIRLSDTGELHFWDTKTNSYTKNHNR